MLTRRGDGAAARGVGRLAEGSSSCESASTVRTADTDDLTSRSAQSILLATDERDALLVTESP